MHWGNSIPAFLVGFGLAGVCAGEVAAAPIAASGEATVTELKKNATLERARARAMERAREAALLAALDGIDGPVDAASRQAVMARAPAWTGAYRVLSSTDDGTRVQVALIVDIDLLRLAKRVEPPVDGARGRRYGLGRIAATPPCEGSLVEFLRAELESVGVVQEKGGAASLQIQVGCAPLGEVPHTHLEAAKLQIAVTQGSRPWLQWSEVGLGNDGVAAMTDAMQRASETLATRLNGEGADFELRIMNPRPAARVRRLERVIEERVRGIRSIEVGAVEPSGAVRLRVQGTVDARTLRRELEGLSLPGFSLTIDPDDAQGTITLRFEEHSVDPG